MNLLSFIPKEYKPLVGEIKEGRRVWNEYTKRWNTTVRVYWKDREEWTEYQNKSYMWQLLVIQKSIYRKVRE